MIYSPAKPGPDPDAQQTLYPSRIGQEVRVLSVSKQTMKDDNGHKIPVKAPYVMEFLKDHFRGIASEEELK